MEFAIAYPARPDAWKDLVVAEDHGFTQTWFYESQMLYSDVFASMALAAEHTKSMKLACGVTIPSNRIDPVTANSIATINLLAPGRTILGIGTGFSGRNAMGLPPVPLKRIRECVETCRRLLRGEEVFYRDGKYERWIRFLHPDRGYINLKDQIPIHLAATGPKALELTGELADGWLTVFCEPEVFRQNLAIVRRGAAKAGRTLTSFPTAISTTACVLRPGENAMSPRVIQRCGPRAIVALHYLWEKTPVGGAVPAALRPLFERFRADYVDRMEMPADRRYLGVHEGHLIYLKPGEERFLSESMIRSTTLTGSAEEIIARLKALEAAGLTQVALQVVSDGRAMIEEFTKEVIAKY